MNRLDELLTKLINGESVENWQSLNRLEQYLVCILTRTGIEVLGEPMNRLEVLLRALYEVVPENAVEILNVHLDQLDPNKQNNPVEILSATLVAKNENN